jgi:hypothetical protein
VVLNKRERNIGIVAGVAIALLVINYAAIDPLMAAKDEIEKQKTDAQGQLAQKVAILKRNEKDTPRWNEISRSGLLHESSAAESQIYRAISSWGQEAGLNPPPSLKTDRTEKYGKYFYKMTIRATANGNMEQIARFMWHFETSTVPVSINDMTISSRKDGQDDLSLQMTISTIYLAPETETPTPQTPQNKSVAMATEVGR